MDAKKQKKIKKLLEKGMHESQNKEFLAARGSGVGEYLEKYL